MPSSPLYLPNISKHKFSDFEKIHKAVQIIAKDIAKSGSDTIITLTPSGKGSAKAYILNISPKFDIKFNDFGDFQTTENANGDCVVAYYIRHNLGIKYPISSITNPLLDTPSSAAMMQLSQNRKKYNILPITHAMDSFENLFKFGKAMRDTIEQAQNKIAVVSLGNLSISGLSRAQEAKKLDEQIIQNLHEKDTNSFISHSPDKINSFCISGFRPLAVVLGLIDKINYNFDNLDYKQSNGMGMMTARFAI